MKIKNDDELGLGFMAAEIKRANKARKTKLAKRIKQTKRIKDKKASV